MSGLLGDFDASAVIYGKFSTYRPSTGATFTLGGTPALSVYKDNSTTQSTTGVTLTVDFDTVTGLNHYAIDTSADGTFYSAGSFFDIVITTGTVDSVSVTGTVVASFTIRKNSSLKPTTAGRTLDVSATGEAGLDWANIGSPTTAVNLSATNIDVDQVVASVSGAVGSVTGLTAATVMTDLDDIQSRLPAALTANGNMKTESLYQGGYVWFDTAGAAGTTNYVHGTVTNPNSSMANSRTIANALNLKAFNVTNGSTVTLDQGYNGFTFFGNKWNLALASRAIAGSHFHGASVTGIATGTDAHFEDCEIGAVTLAPCLITRSVLSGTITVGAAGVFTLFQCGSSSVAGVDTIIDFDAVGATTIGLRDWTGGIEVRNMAAGDVLSLNGMGRLTVASSCTAGSLFVSGMINLVNNGSGQTIADSSRYNEDQNVANVTGTCATVTTLTNLPAITANWLTAAGTAADFTTEIQTGLATAAALTTVAGYIDTEVADIQARLPAALVGGRIDASVGAMASNVITAAATAADFSAEVADGMLDRDMSTGTDSGSPTVRTMRQALRFLRNKWSISGTTLTVTKEDDATASWTATVSTDAAALPVVGNDPA